MVEAAASLKLKFNLTHPSLVEKLMNLGQDDNAEMLSGQYQGDIVMTDDEIRALEGGKAGRAGLIAQRYIWAGAVVPYRIVEAHFSKRFHTQLRVEYDTRRNLSFSFL